MTPRRGRLGTVLDIALLWAMIGVAAAAFWPVYRDTAYLVVVATGGAFLRGLRPLAVTLVGVLTVLVSMALVAAKFSLH